MPYPSKYTKALADRVCARIAEGRSLRDICRDKDVPVAASSVTQWVLTRDEFAKQYARACGLRAEARFEELMELADHMAVLEPDEEGKLRIACADREAVNAMRAKIDVLKWALAKMKPEKYSDKLQMEHSGEQHTEVVVRYADD